MNNLQNKQLWSGQIVLILVNHGQNEPIRFGFRAFLAALCPGVFALIFPASEETQGRGAAKAQEESSFWNLGRTVKGSGGVPELCPSGCAMMKIKTQSDRGSLRPVSRHGQAAPLICQPNRGKN
jgi:hypothetical protein